jgi:hypothetical protein
MGQPTRPRFATAQEALRFYFRVEELLAEQGRMPDREPDRASNVADVVKDFLGIAVCVQGLDGFERWLLRELYGPTCFDARERTLMRAFEAARRRFPGRSASAKELARTHRAALDKLAGQFRRSGLVGSAVHGRVLRQAG